MQEIKVTKGCRFNAAKRLEASERRRTSLIAFVSVCVIVVSLLPTFLATPEWLSGVITLLTVAFSVAILALSLMRTSNADAVKGEQLQRCAAELNSLRRLIRSDPGLDEVKLADYSKQYDSILQRFNINHDDVDFEKYKLEHPKEYPDTAKQDTAEMKKEVSREARQSYIVALTIAGSTLAAALAALLETILPEIDGWLRVIKGTVGG